MDPKYERNILTRLNHPFLVRLHYSFQSQDKLFFIMDYINGGELFYHLQRVQIFPEDQARFYAAEIALALSYLHSNGIVYRDLKPENILITSEGHIVLTDFGLAKEGLNSTSDRTATFCGTPEYLAPEVLQGKGYGKAVDWWSFGTLLYEMMSGLPPFYSEDVQEMYSAILYDDLAIPESMSNPAAEILAQLLDRDDKTRLQDIEQIKAQPFFEPLDFSALVQKQVTPPWIPETKGVDDTSNIDETFVLEPVTLDDENDAVESDANAQSFEGFTYTGKK